MILPASAVTVRSDAELAVVVPAQSGATDYVTAPAVPTDNACQVEVTVSNRKWGEQRRCRSCRRTGSTEEAQPPDTELVAAATEFDYAPAADDHEHQPEAAPPRDQPVRLQCPDGDH